MKTKDLRMKKISFETAKTLFEIEAINFNLTKPYKLASGVLSPVYIDCRKIISFPNYRKKIIGFFQEILKSQFENEDFQNIAGGETAGIPIATLLAERLKLPLCYVRKKPKGYGINAQIEGNIEKNQNVLLVEDLATNGLSKLNFVNAIRASGATCNTIFVIFYYNIFDQTEELFKRNGLKLSYLATWQDVLGYARSEKIIDKEVLNNVEEFLEHPLVWSKKQGGN